MNEPRDWRHVELPRTWPDRLRLRFADLWRLFATVLLRRRGKVEVPDDLPGKANIPKYVLQEFHNLPNGNYSHRITAGYAKGFDHAMLGTLREGRRRIAQALRGAHTALDLGCGAGHVAIEMERAGITEIWGLDPSPYLLRQAAQRAPHLRWLQGVGEDSGLPDAHFDAVGVCFVFHEVPPSYLRKTLAELQRITVPGARLAILEPSPLQWQQRAWTLLRRYGWRGLYFRWMALRVFEPFADAWHQFDVHAEFAAHGFHVQRDEIGCPFRFIVAQRHPLSTEPATS